MSVMANVSCAIQKFFEDANITASHAQVQEFLAAGLGYNTLAAYQNSPEENPGLDYAEYVLLDTEAMRCCAADFGIADFPTQDVILIFNQVAPSIRVFASFLDFVEEIHTQVDSPSVMLSDEVSSAMSITNAWIANMDITCEEPGIELAKAQHFWSISVSAVLQGELVPDETWGGGQVNLSCTVRLMKVGRRCLANPEVLDLSATVVMPK